MEAPFIPVRKQPVRKGGPLVPDNLYRLLNRYECPSGTGIDERFSTSVTTVQTDCSFDKLFKSYDFQRVET